MPPIARLNAVCAARASGRCVAAPAPARLRPYPRAAPHDGRRLDRQGNPTTTRRAILLSGMLQQPRDRPGPQSARELHRFLWSLERDLGAIAALDRRHLDLGAERGAERIRDFA